jgi:RNA polymerase sigma-70 factor (ECF subfamily)
VVVEFAELVEAESRGLIAAVTAIVGDVARAEEITQDAFERCFLRWRRVSRMDRPGAWVRRVAINRAISVRRRSTTERGALARLAGIGSVSFGSPVHGALVLADESGVWAAVRALPEDQAAAVALRYAADLGIADIASTLHCTEAAVKSLLHRARTTLRDSPALRDTAPGPRRDRASVPTEGKDPTDV